MSRQEAKTDVGVFCVFRSHHLYNGVTVCLCFLSGPNRGHYITIVKSHGFWLLFDDDIVEVRHTHSQPCCSQCTLTHLFVHLKVCIFFILSVNCILLVSCRKSTPRPSRSFTDLPQTSPRTLSRDTSSSTSPGSDWSWIGDTGED